MINKSGTLLNGGVNKIRALKKRAEKQQPIKINSNHYFFMQTD
jgi:hypothetical protein